MGKQPTLVLADQDYNHIREHLFRRELETFLTELVSFVDQVSNGTSTNSSLYSKRSSYALPIGTVTLT